MGTTATLKKTFKAQNYKRSARAWGPTACHGRFRVGGVAELGVTPCGASTLRREGFLEELVLLDLSIGESLPFWLIWHWA